MKATHRKSNSTSDVSAVVFNELPNLPTEISASSPTGNIGSDI